VSRIHLLDTNVLRSWVDGNHARHAAVLARVGKLGDPYIFLSVVTVAEVESGLARPHRLTAQLVGEIRQALRRFQVLEIDRHACEPYGRMRAWLLGRYAPRIRRGKLRSLSELADPVTDLQLGIQENDLWLASQAVATDSVLVTGDQKMRRLVDAATATGDELRLANW
jgi:predicted nucleic acid-binding protein